MNTEATKISMTAAIALLRTGNLKDLSTGKIAALREAIVTHPAITGFDGCSDALERLDAAEHERTNLIVETKAGRPESPRKKWMKVAMGAAALLALLLGGGFSLSWFHQRLETPIAEAAEMPAPVNEPPALETSAINTPAAEVSEPSVPTLAVPGATSEAFPKVVSVEEISRPTIQVTGAGARLLDEPDGGFLLTPVNGQDVVKLIGKAPRLIVSGLDGECRLDLEELQCPLIEFRGKINGLTKIIVKSPGAAIDFRGAINGNPHISIDVPGGKVRFFENVQGSATLLLNVAGGEILFAGNDTDKARAGGGVSVQATARTVEFSGGMEAGARADVTLGAAGNLRFSRLDGGSSIHYRKAADSDPAPTVEGDRSGTGTLVAVATASR